MLVVLLAFAVAVTVAPGSLAQRDTAALGALSIKVLVDGMYSQKSNGHGGVLGFDANGDGKIDIHDEGLRDDAKARTIDWHKVFDAMGRFGHRGRYVTRPQALQFWGRFDRTHDGRLDAAHGEFQRAYDAVWGRGMAADRHARPSYSAFDQYPFE